MTLLEVDAIDVHLGGRAVLRDITVVVPEGGLIAILGRNGVGKTSLLRTIFGLYRPSAGAIRFDGTAIGGMQPHRVVRHGIAHTPEGRQLFAEMPVVENLRAGALHLSKEAFAARLAEVVWQFPILGERSAQLAGSLSGGEQQMLSIGRAMMSSPRLLLLDEPSLGLAPRMVAQIFDLIRSVRSAGVSVLLVEQNARLALSVADYGYVLDHGRIAIEGPSEALANDPDVVSAYLGEESNEMR